MNNLSKFRARHFVYNEDGFYRYFNDYSIAYSVAFRFSLEYNIPCYIHSVDTHKTFCMAQGNLVDIDYEQ